MPDQKVSDTHTIYELACPFLPQTEEEKKSSVCPEKRYTSSSSYRVFPEQGKVINSRLIEYKNCKIMDAKNWKCKDYVQIIMKDGELSKYDFNNYEENEKLIAQNIRNPQVPYWLWWSFSIYQFFRDIF